MSSQTVLATTDRVQIRRALLSVADKTGLDTLVRAFGPEVTLYSTGGTFALLERALTQFPAAPALVSVEAYTGHPEMPGGLVKTLHPRIHGGLLADLHEPAQVAFMATHGVETFDMVVASLYPFEKTVAQAGATPDEIRHQIDIGGPTMVRAAAKNYPRVAVVVDPADYPGLVDELQQHGGTLSFATRWRLACKAFEHVAAYDRAIADHFAAQHPEQLREAHRVGR